MLDLDKDTRGRQYKPYRDLIKEYDKMSPYMVRCNCSHTMLLTNKKERIICSHCGYWVYRDKKTEMKYKLKELLK